MGQRVANNEVRRTRRENRNYLGVAGEHFVAAHLAIRGYTIAKPEPDEGKDLWVSSSHSDTLTRVRVKTRHPESRQTKNRSFRYQFDFNSRIIDERSTNSVWVFVLWNPIPSSPIAQPTKPNFESAVSAMPLQSPACVVIPHSDFCEFTEIQGRTLYTQASGQKRPHFFVLQFDDGKITLDNRDGTELTRYLDGRDSHWPKLSETVLPNTIGDC